MCTWSGIRWPSSIRLSFCAAKRRRTSPRYGRSWPNRAFRRPFGMNTTWYLHSQREWLRLSNSSIVARPSVCLAAHGSERHDGPPNMSNFCCLPGIAGGLPVFIYRRGVGHRVLVRWESVLSWLADDPDDLALPPWRWAHRFPAEKCGLDVPEDPEAVIFQIALFPAPHPRHQRWRRRKGRGVAHLRARHGAPELPSCCPPRTSACPCAG